MHLTDPTGHALDLSAVPQRIVSLVPSQTELLHDLGLEAEVVGITKFCIHPERWFREKVRVGGTKNPKLDVIRSLEPHLILANKEENRLEDIEALRQEFPVYTTDVVSVNDALNMIQTVGRLVGREQEATEWCTRGEVALQTLRSATPPQKVLYLIWRKPWMAVGNDTFITHLLKHCGLEVMVVGDGRYPEFELASLEVQPDLVLLSSEPYPFKDKHIAELRMHFPQAQMLLTDGEAWSWYGTRWIKKSADIAAFLRKLAP